jgi:hypothetical protein
MSERDVPALRVVHGHPAEDEVAAVVTVLAARLAARERAAREAAAAASRGARQARGGWRDRSSLIGGPMTPGPGAWRASAFPRG